jgi:transcriptional regulator with XRE-family HTH domain
MYFNPFPELIRRIRLDKKLTQKQLGKRVGATQSTISAWENGRTRPNLKTEQKIYKGLGTTDAEIGEMLFEIVGNRFGYDRSGPGAQAAPPRVLAKIEALFEEVVGDLTSEDFKFHELELQNIKNLEGDLKRFIWAFEDKLNKAAEKAGKTDTPD